MAKLIIEQVPGADGEYSFDFDERGFTNGELHLIKTQTGVRAGEIEDAFSAGDNDLMVALALIVLKRNAKLIPAEALWDAPAGCLTFEMPDAEDDAVPPLKGLDSSSDGSGSSEPSGADSANGGGSLPSIPRPIGEPVSHIGHISDPVT